MTAESIKKLMTEEDMDQAMGSVARDIIADGTENIALVGIKTRGVPIAGWLARKIESIQHKPIDMGILDIQLYRDDLSEIDENPVVVKRDFPFSITGKGIILVDDVLYTGRTTRAALDALVSHGRPRFVKLMVMVDRGWRELPIEANYVAKSLKTTATQNVKVRLSETDGVNEIVVKG